VYVVVVVLVLVVVVVLVLVVVVVEVVVVVQVVVEFTTTGMDLVGDIIRLLLGTMSRVVAKVVSFLLNGKFITAESTLVRNGTINCLQFVYIIIYNVIHMHTR